MSETNNVFTRPVGHNYLVKEAALIEGRNNNNFKTYINSNATFVPSNRFEDYTGLETITLSNVSIVYESAFVGCAALKTVNLPNATIIKAGAFQSCTNLTTLNLPNVSTIETQAFENCTGLTSLTLPKILVIGSSAFKSCTSLESLTLYSTANVDQTTRGSILASAFTSCTNLRYLTLGYLTPPTIVATVANTFGGTILNNSKYTPTNASSTAWIHVPAGTADTYKSSAAAKGGKWGTNYLKPKITEST